MTNQRKSTFFWVKFQFLWKHPQTEWRLQAAQQPSGVMRWEGDVYCWLTSVYRWRGADGPEWRCWEEWRIVSTIRTLNLAQMVTELQGKDVIRFNLWTPFGQVRGEPLQCQTKRYQIMGAVFPIRMVWSMVSKRSDGSSTVGAVTLCLSIAIKVSFWIRRRTVIDWMQFSVSWPETRSLQQAPWSYSLQPDVTGFY